MRPIPARKILPGYSTTKKKICSFVSHRVVNAAEAAELLGCSRQNINDLSRKGKLHPIKATEKSTLYLKSEVQKRNWK